MKWSARIVTLSLVTLLPFSGRAQEAKTHESEIKIEHIPARTVIYRDVRGDYSLHPKVCAALMNYIGKRYRSSGVYFGIYPVDPDTVSSTARLRWAVAIPIADIPANESSESLPKDFQRPQAPYRLKIMPAVEAAVLESTVRDTALNGLSMYRWMLENGYVQVAPTQMEYLDLAKDPMNVRTRIIIPVVRRRSGLKLPKE